MAMPGARLVVPQASAQVEIPVSGLANLPAEAYTLSQAGGGTIFVRGPGTYHATATIAPAAKGAISKVDIVFDSGAQVVIDSGVTFPTSVTGSVNYTKLWDFSNCSNCIITGLNDTNNNPTSTTTANAANSITDVFIGGNASHLRFVDCYAKGFTRWQFYITGFSAGVTGLGTVDGPVDDILFIRPVGVNLGFYGTNPSATGDGGGLKIANNTGVVNPFAPVTNIGCRDPDWTNVYHSFFDVTLSCATTDNFYTALGTSSATAIVNGNYWIDGGQGQMNAGVNSSVSQFGVWVENMVNWTTYASPGRTVKVKNFVADMNSHGGTNDRAFNISNTMDDVLLEGCEARNCIGTIGAGFALSSGTTAGQAARAGYGYTIRDCSTYNCGTQLYLNAKSGVNGSSFNDVLVDGLTCQDGGFGNATLGVTLLTTATNFLRNVRIRNMDITHLAPGSQPLSFANFVNDPMENSINFEQCPGITPLGGFPGNHPGINVYDTDLNWIGNKTIGGAASPATTLVYYMSPKMGGTIAATAAGTRTALSILDERTLPLVAFSQMSSVSGSAASPTTATTYTVTGTDMILTLASGSGTATITVTDFAGNALTASSATTATALFLPQGTTVVVGGTIAGSTWTVTDYLGNAIANPFIASMTGIAIPTTSLRYGATVSDTWSASAVWTTKLVPAAYAAAATNATAYGQMRTIGINAASSATCVITTAKYYKCTVDMKLDLDLTTAPTITIFDQYGVTAAAPLDATGTHVVVDVPAGYIVAPTYTTLTAINIAHNAG